MADLSLELREITKRFGSTTAVDRVNLQIQRGEFFALLGPSGCGKTTLLRLIAGFEMADSGSILLHGQDIAPLPPYKRPVNTVFQHYSLFPHMNVFQNIAFGLERKGMPPGEIHTVVGESLELVRLSGFEKRRPSQLSGGQKQRIALARALVCHPEVLLLDEPLGALDMKLRKEMQLELKRLHEKLKLTFIFVTHDQEEALVMSDRIAIMNQGHIEQVGIGSTEIFERPRTEFVANFMGATNIFEATAIPRDGGSRIQMANDVQFDTQVRTQGTIRFVVRPEKMLLSPAPAPGRVSLPVTVVEEVFQGTNTNWIVDYKGLTLVVIEQNSRMNEETTRFQRGDKAFASWNPQHTVILEE
jgi:spermidine/putrescine transport system ATP-binding protein